MKILITGKGGKAGSWKIRGEQLGAAIGADVIPKASLADCKDADIIIAVKRLNHPFVENIKASGKPWIWDAVDPYPQPACTSWDREYAIEWVRDQIERHNPNGVIYPNRKMMEDVGVPGTVIYHHCRPNVPINPIRKKVSIVGYDGGLQYLGKWRGLIELECKKRGWQFRTDIPLHEMDIVVAFRDNCGYVQKSWKSQIKLANAHGSGTPFVGQPECAYLETAAGPEYWVADIGGLSDSFDSLESHEKRLEVSKIFLESRISLDIVSEQVKKYAEEIFTSRSSQRAI